MSFSDIQHYATMINGCEAISRRDYKSGDAAYASAVLQLHANDMGSYAGQEGFLDTVKKGAASTVEFVKKLIEAIKKWSAQAWTSTVNFLKNTYINNLKGLRSEDRSGLASRVKKAVEACDKLPDDVNEGGVIASGNQLIKDLEQNDSKKNLTSLNDFFSKITKVKDSYIKYVESKKPSDGENSSEYSKAAKGLSEFVYRLDHIVAFAGTMKNVTIKSK